MRAVLSNQSAACLLRLTAFVRFVLSYPLVTVNYSMGVDVRTLNNMSYPGCHFTEHEMLELVRIYKDYDCLWNATHPLYKDNFTRRKAYKEILKKLNIPKLTVQDVPKKIKNLRSSYYQEIKRIRNSVRSGATGDKVYKPKVAWFTKADEFLRAVRNEREPFSKRQIKVIGGHKLAKQIENTPVQVKIDTTSNLSERITPSIRDDEDEFDSFGKYIATTLRLMPREFSIIAKTELQKAISDIQLRIVREINARSVPSPCYSAASDYDHHSNSGCLTPTSDTCVTNVKIEFED